MGSGVSFTLGMGLAPPDPPFLPRLRFGGSQSGWMSKGVWSPELLLPSSRGLSPASSLPSMEAFRHPHCSALRHSGRGLLGSCPFAQHQGPGNPWLPRIRGCQPWRPRDPAKMNEYL